MNADHPTTADFAANDAARALADNRALRERIDSLEELVAVLIEMVDPEIAPATRDSGVTPMIDMLKPLEMGWAYINLLKRKDLRRA